MPTRKLQNFVDGRQTDAADGNTYPLINPSTGEEFAQAPASTQPDVDAGVRQLRDVAAVAARGVVDGAGLRRVGGGAGRRDGSLHGDRVAKDQGAGALKRWRS